MKNKVWSLFTIAVTIMFNILILAVWILAVFNLGKNDLISDIAIWTSLISFITSIILFIITLIRIILKNESIVLSLVSLTIMTLNILLEPILAVIILISTTTGFY